MEKNNQQTQTEILHENKFDVIRNSDADTTRRNGIEQLVLSNIRSGKDPLVGWHPLPKNKKSTEKDFVFVDNLFTPHFFGKRKTITKEHPLFKAALKMPGDEIEKRAIYAMNSVQNEIRLSPQIKRAIADKEMQDQLKGLGFKGITFIEPMLATINKITSEKLVFYQHVKGKPLAMNEDITNQAILMIRKHLERVGIRPVDLKEDSVLFDDEGNLYLTDTEGYLKL